VDEREREASGEKEVTEEAPAGDDVEALKSALAEEKSKAESYLANWQRAQADFINLKRRTEQERAELAKFAASAIVAELLPVLDDFDLALENVPEGSAETNWIDGIRLIQRRLRSVLEAQGLAQIEALGKDFDPYFHEAVMFADGEEGKVVEEVQKGYTFHDRLLRPTKVKVGRGGNNREPLAQEEKNP
jgi:molecular chaperone GrpE